MVLLENYAAHHQRWSNCFNDPKMSDVVFEAKDGQTFHCEKFVLEVASPYFKKLFDRKCGDPPKYIAAKDVEPGALKWILRACYTGDGEVDDDNVVSVMVAAGLYGMDWVEKACMQYLKGDQGKPIAAFEYSKDNQKWQEWIVPESGWYHIVALGAKAGDGTRADCAALAKGGEGAVIGGSFELEVGDLVHILTGGMSRIVSSGKFKDMYTGGGGGTFVALKATELSLLIAAGGGGGVLLPFYGIDATMNENGTSSNIKCQGGKGGGNGMDHSIFGKGGLGWKAGPAALATPKGTSGTNNGGFGGGGNGLGGGGGYSGGSAGYLNSAGGGGSYIASKAKNVWKMIASSGHGKVYIWRGKKLPSKHFLFQKPTGNIDTNGGSNESLDSWEILE